jgi:hypothetical protein
VVPELTRRGQRYRAPAAALLLLLLRRELNGMNISVRIRTEPKDAQPRLEQGMTECAGVRAVCARTGALRRYAGSALASPPD